MFALILIAVINWQSGQASHLGCGWDGKMGASGLTYDCNMPLAAHKSLPFGVIIEVRNPKNGRVVKQIYPFIGEEQKGKK